MGSDGLDDEGAGGVLPLGGLEDTRDVKSVSRVVGMVVVIGGGGPGGGGDLVNEGVHMEAS